MKFNFIKGGKCFQNSARLSCCQLFIRGIPVVLIILPVELSYSEFCSGFQHAIVRDCFQICPIQLYIRGSSFGILSKPLSDSVIIRNRDSRDCFQSFVSLICFVFNFLFEVTLLGLISKFC